MSQHERLENRLVDLVRERLRAKLLEMPATAQAALVRVAAALLEEEILGERHRCVELCRERAALWQRTPFSEPMDEARARANEAQYLADLLEAEPGAPAPPDA
jgi:hypothetical protein